MSEMSMAIEFGNFNLGFYMLYMSEILDMTKLAAVQQL